MQKLPLPTGFVFSEDFDETGPPKLILGDPIIDAGRRKPVPRTLVDAFPVSEGYRVAAGRIAPDGSTEVNAAPPRGLLAWLTPDRVCWLIVLGLAGFALRWAWLAPKVPT